MGTPVEGTLNALRRFRNVWMVQSDAGRRYLALLEQHNAELNTLLTSDAAFRAQALGVLIKLVKHVRTKKTVESKPIDPLLVAEIDAAMQRIAPKASPGLRNAIDSVRLDLARFVGVPIAAGLSAVRH